MKTKFSIIIGVAIVGSMTALIIGTLDYQTTYNQNCNSDGGYVTGFLKCTYVHEDFGLPNPFRVDLEFGKTFQHDDLNIKFYDIEDSRCPLDVTCIWEGNVTAMLNVSNQTHDIGGPIPIGFTIDYIKPYEITLTEIQPPPISTKKPDYVATLQIKKISKPNITNEPEEGYERLKYRTTSSVIQDTYLSKTVQQWQDTPRWQLEAKHGEYGDEFYVELGKLLVKNEMVNQIQKNNIILENYNFEVYSGMMLTSLPPHISYQAVVNDTSNRVFLLEGSSHANQVNFYKTSELKFPELSDQLPADYILTKPQSITILPEEGNNARAEPNNAIIHSNDNSVEFINTTPFTIRIQDSGSGRISEEHELAWIGPVIKPNHSAVVNFDSPGYYEWDARTAPTIEQPDWWGSHAGGRIVLLSDDVNNLPFEDRVKMAGTIVMESDIPLVGLGMGNNEGLRVDFNQAIINALPGASQYYKQKILQLIPFDVPVIIQE